MINFIAFVVCTICAIVCFCFKSPFLGVSQIIIAGCNFALSLDWVVTHLC